MKKRCLASVLLVLSVLMLLPLISAADAEPLVLRGEYVKTAEGVDLTIVISKNTASLASIKLGVGYSDALTFKSAEAGPAAFGKNMCAPAESAGRPYTVFFYDASATHKSTGALVTLHFTCSASVADYGFTLGEAMAYDGELSALGVKLSGVSPRDNGDDTDTTDATSETTAEITPEATTEETSETTTEVTSGTTAEVTSEITPESTGDGTSDGTAESDVEVSTDAGGAGDPTSEVTGESLGDVTTDRVEDGESGGCEKAGFLIPIVAALIVAGAAVVILLKKRK